MNKQYKKEGDNLIITVPLKARRYDPWTEELTEEMDNIIGVFESEDDNGLAHRIDMSYKGKPDQYTTYFYKLDGSKEDFDAMIKELEIDAIYVKKD